MTSSLRSIGHSLQKFTVVEILRVQSAPHDPHWMVAVLEEMNVLTGNHT